LNELLPIITIVDDEPDVRDALALLLKSMSYPVQTFETAYEYWGQFNSDQPGCVILDVRMPGMSGLELQQQLNKLDYHPPIIMISGHGELTMAVNTIRDGAIDFLQKPISEQILLERVSQALQKDQLSRKQHAKLLRVKNRYKTLTAREKEVLALVVRGKLNKVIAVDLDVSTRTIEIHRSRVMEKMQSKSLAQLMREISVLEDNQQMDSD